MSQNFVLRHEADSCARASCQKAPLFDTRESIGEKSVAHVPGFFRFLLKSGFARKSYRLLQQSELSSSEDSFCVYIAQKHCRNFVDSVAKVKKCLVNFGFCLFTQKMPCAIIKVYKRELLPSETEIF